MMISYIESFGFDGRGLKQNPYSFYSDDNYRLETLYADDLKIKMATLFDFSKYMNRKIYDAGWQLLTNRDFPGTGGTIPAGSSLKFGIYR